MPFGPKRTVGISGHYSEAWTIAPRLGAEACGSQWKHAEDAEDSEAVEGMWVTREGLEGVWEVRKRSGRPWESAEEAGRHGK